MDQTGDVRCGANGNVSLSFNVTPPYFIYKCGVYEGQFQKAQESSASIQRAGKANLIKLAFVYVILQLLCLPLVGAISADTPGYSNPGIVAPVNMTSDTDKSDGQVVLLPTSYDIKSVLETYADTKAYLVDTKNGTVIYDIKSNDTVASNSTLARRYVTYDNDVWQHTFKEMQTVQSGEWWTEWYPVSGCLYTGLSDAGGSLSLNWQYTYSWSWGIGVDIDFGAVKVSTGYSISQSESHGGEITCNVNGYSGAQAWYQQKVMWADIQVRNVWYDNGNGWRYEPWSPYIRINAPFTDCSENGRKVGCSTGFDNLRC